MSSDSGRRWWRILQKPAALALAAAVLGASLAAAQNDRTSQAGLQAVRKEINALESRLARQITQRDDGARALRAAELEIAAAIGKLGGLRTDLRTQQAAQRSLGEQTNRANRRLDAEREALGRQVRASYMTGRAEIFKLLLSQQSPASLGRMLVYYEYYNRDRSERIGVVSTELQQLQELATASDRVRRELAALEVAQASEVEGLARSRDERRTLVASLDASIKDANSAIAKLRAEESRLAELVVQLRELMAGFPVDTEQPFGSLKGKLPWPVRGRLAGDYGQPRGGGSVKWNGVLLETAAGTPVRSVYHGRVAFADWLPGLGLLIIVDHGNGYMSLYGHNEALLKESGDWVEPGEAIAQVGDTGGQARPSLYFEIRQNGEPVNPHAWIAGNPAPR